MKSKFTLTDLSALLRDQSKWPKDFVWNYIHPLHCAIGLLNAMNITHHGTYDTTSLAEFFSLPYETCLTIFSRAWLLLGIDLSDMTHKETCRAIQTITPEQIADLIDKAIKETL